MKNGDSGKSYKLESTIPHRVAGGFVFLVTSVDLWLLVKNISIQEVFFTLSIKGLVIGVILLLLGVYSLTGLLTVAMPKRIFPKAFKS